VYGEDPAVNRLEERAAEVIGKEAAIFVPTGTMGNQIGIRLHTQHGQEVICESRAHVLDWEMGMIAAFSGCTARTVAGERGVMRWEQIEAAIAPGLYYRAQTGLIVLENTHNMAGGTVYPMAVLEEIWAGAARVGLPVHLDGARVFNAAVAMGVSVAEATRGFATVSFCLSKGLGAPVGSVLVGSKEQIVRARSLRKALGGGMRQAGILAAAGLMALEQGPERLYKDHESARAMAEIFAESPGVRVDLDSVQTNIVFFSVDDAPGLVAKLKAEGILSSAIGPHQVRFVTHCDVSFEECQWAAKRVAALV
jgi:threonine aldolase